ILRATKPTLSDSGALCECRYDDYLGIDGCANPSPTQSGNELIAAYEYFALHKASRRKLISSRNLYQYVKLTLSSQTEYGAASRFASSWNPTSSPLLESDQGGIVMLISTALVIQSHRFEDDLTGRITLEFPYQMIPGLRSRLWTIGAGRRPSPFGGIPDVPGVIAKRIQVALRCKVVPQTTHTLIYVELQR